MVLAVAACRQPAPPAGSQARSNLSIASTERPAKVEKVEMELRPIEFAPGFLIDMPPDIVRAQVEGQIAPSFSRKAYDDISVVLSVHSRTDDETAQSHLEAWMDEASSWRSRRWEVGFTKAPVHAPDSASTVGVDADGEQLACLVLAWPGTAVRAVLLLPPGNRWKESWALAAVQSIRPKPS